MPKQDYLGRSFHNYRLSAQLAKNKHSSVYLARSSVSTPEVAVVKIFHAPLSSLTRRQHFLQDIQVLRTFENFHFLRILDGGIEQGQPFLIMEHAEYDSLLTYMGRFPEKRMPLSDVVSLLEQVDEGLLFLYQQGRVHGKIKAENIFVTADAQIRFVDMSIAGIDAEIPDEELTPQYDSYMVSCLAYEMLSGHTASKKAGASPLPSHFNEYLSPEVDQVFEKALATEADDRYRSAEQFVQALRNALPAAMVFAAAATEAMPRIAVASATQQKTTNAKTVTRTQRPRREGSFLTLMVAVIVALLLIGSAIALPALHHPLLHMTLIPKKVSDEPSPAVSQQKSPTIAGSPSSISTTPTSVVTMTATATPSVTVTSTPVPTQTVANVPQNPAPTKIPTEAPVTVVVQNASFEAPAVGNSYVASPQNAGWSFQSSNSFWSNNGEAGITGNNSSLTRNAGDAPDGQQAAFLQNTGSMSQTLQFPAGTFKITFAAEQSVNNHGNQYFQVLLDNQVIGSFTPAGSESYESYSTQGVTVSAGNHTLTFRGQNNSGHTCTAFVDVVAVVSAS